MLRRPTGSGFAAALVATAVAVAATLVSPAPAYANVRYRAESPHDTTSPKSVTASCPPGDVLMGTGGRIKGGGGGVRLAAMVPTGTSVEVTGEAFAEHEGAWSVVAVAFCAPAGSISPTVVASPAGSSTATCPAGTVVSGTGFDLPDGTPLTGLVPDPDGDSVTVSTPYLLIGGTRVAYAVCVPGSPAPGGGPYYHRLEATSPVDTSSQKTVVVTEEWDYQFPSMSGAGGQVRVFRDPTDPFPAITAGIFIHTLMPSEDGSRVTVEAARRSTTTRPPFPPPPFPTSLPGPGARAAGDGAVAAGPAAAGDRDDLWSVTGYGTDHDIY